MKSLLVLAAAFAIVVASSGDAFARRGGMGGGMVCNIQQAAPAAPAPAQATAQNLAQIAATNIYRPMQPAAAGVSVLDVRTISGVELRALQALNAKPGAGVPDSVRNVAAK
jgi:hypothetical protein